VPVFYENVLKQVSVFPSACVCTKICFCFSVCQTYWMCISKCMVVWFIFAFLFLKFYWKKFVILCLCIMHNYHSFLFAWIPNYHYITSAYYAFFQYSYFNVFINCVCGKKKMFFFRKSFHFQTFYYFSLIRISNNPFNGGFSFPSALHVLTFLNVAFKFVFKFFYFFYFLPFLKTMYSFLDFSFNKHNK
jgi:hypothetical protein